MSKEEGAKALSNAEAAKALSNTEAAKALSNAEAAKLVGCKTADVFAVKESDTEVKVITVDGRKLVVAKK